MALVAAAAATLAGCGNSGSPTAGSASANGPGTTVRVSETEYRLAPDHPKVSAGRVTLQASNDGEYTHSLEVDGPNGDVGLGKDLAPGATGNLTVDLSQPGKYEFYCPIDEHRQRGMEGEIVVR